jgi:YHS domain-containing protein
MNTHSLRLAMAFAAALVPGVALAQQEAHQAGAGQASPEMGQCARVQPVVDNIIAASMARLELARQSNNPAEMRAAVDQLEAALRDIRTQLAPCSAAAADPSAGHAMPGMQQTPGTPRATAPMDHSKRPMGGTPAANSGAATGAKPAAPAAPMNDSKMPMSGTPAAKPGAATGTKPGVPAPPMDHSKRPMGGTPAAKPRTATGTKPAAMDHSKMPIGGEAKPGKAMDPVNGLMVEPATAPNTMYEGQTYYFSSEQTRKEFLGNPAKFARKPKA